MKRKKSNIELDEYISDDVVSLIKSNHVLFYAEINNKTFAKLRKILIEFEAKKTSGPKTLYFHINSPGGDAISGLGIYDIICQMTAETVCIVEGLCASAATLMALACKHRYMTRNSSMMIHQIWGSFEGTFKEQQVDLNNTTVLMNKYIQIYKEKTTMRKPQIIKEIQQDSEMDLEMAIVYGFIQKDWAHFVL
jgi:ATP-dependent Clp endopeptidase proteolytic subunit ClpP